jgi:hypothetical protein
MSDTLKNENEYGGWFSPIAGGFYTFPVTIKGFCNIRDWEHLVIDLRRGGKSYDKITVNFTLADEKYREFSIETSRVRLGPAYLQAIIYDKGAIVDWLPDVEDFYVLTPPE